MPCLSTEQSSFRTVSPATQSMPDTPAKVMIRKTLKKRRDRGKVKVHRSFYKLVPLLLIALYCHSLIAAGGAEPDDVEKGRQLTNKYACKSCHLIEASGSFVAPPLDGIKAHRNFEYIEEKLSSKNEPKNESLRTLMYHVKITKSDASKIASYLLSLPESKIHIKGHAEASLLSDNLPAGSHFQPLKESDSTRAGQKAFFSKGCIACHKVTPDIGGSLGPSLHGVGARRSRNFIEARIENGALFIPRPQETSGRRSMPALKLSQKEKKDIINYLLSLPPD